MPIYPPGHQPEPDASVPPDIFEGKTASYAKACRWVFENLAKSGITAKDAPSAGAWTLYDWAKSNEMARHAFLTTIMPRFLPTQKEMDANQRFTDEARSAKQLIAGLRKAGVRMVRDADQDEHTGPDADPA